MANLSKSQQNLVKFVQLAVLIALIVVFSFTGLGYIKIGIVEITLNCIPVAIGAIVLGPVAGAICGATFGLTSFIQCFGMSAFGAMLLNISPVRTFITAFCTRVLVGLLTGLVFKAFKEKKTVGCAVASICCPVFNTLLFIGTFILLFKNSAFESVYNQLGATNLINFFVAFCGLNGLLEIITCFIISTPASRAIIQANKKLK